MNVHEVEDRAHSEVGFSSLERVLNCTASVGASRGILAETSTYAIDGTAAHTVSEWCREQRVSPWEFKGGVVRVRHDGTFTDVKIDRDMCKSVETFVNAVKRERGDELIEQRLSIEAFARGGFGTLDAAKLRPRAASVIEFKHGKGVQKFARDNPQLLGQALGVFLEYDWLYGFKTFSLAVSQPRLNHYDVWECSTEDVLWWAETVLRPAIDEAYGPRPVFAAGSWCQFCKYKHQCPVRANDSSRRRAPIKAEDEFINLNGD